MNEQVVVSTQFSPAAGMAAVSAGLQDQPNQAPRPGQPSAGHSSTWMAASASLTPTWEAQQSPVPPHQPRTHPWMERLLQELSLDEDDTAGQVTRSLL